MGSEAGKKGWSENISRRRFLEVITSVAGAAALSQIAPSPNRVESQEPSDKTPPLIVDSLPPFVKKEGLVKLQGEPLLYPPDAKTFINKCRKMHLENNPNILTTDDVVYFAFVEFPDQNQAAERFRNGWYSEQAFARVKDIHNYFNHFLGIKVSAIPTFYKVVAPKRATEYQSIGDVITDVRPLLEEQTGFIRYAERRYPVISYALGLDPDFYQTPLYAGAGGSFGKEGGDFAAPIEAVCNEDPDYKRFVYHEFGHAIGLHHPIETPDSEEYKTSIMWRIVFDGSPRAILRSDIINNCTSPEYVNNLPIVVNKAPY